MPKLIVFAHGIGDAPENFFEQWVEVIDWKSIIGKPLADQSEIVVKGLWWQDVLQKVADKYPVISNNMAELVTMCGFADLEKWVASPEWKEVQDYVMDVLVYVGLDDMWQYIQDTCALKLEGLRRDASGKEIFAEADTILIGHSLGAAMLPQLVWREYADTGTVPYRGMVLLASPLGFESPLPKVCEDFIQRMGEMYGGSRDNTIARFARAWNMVGNNRLKFICNQNDIVCSNESTIFLWSGKLI